MTERRDDEDAIPTEWLDKKISIEEAEAAHPGISDERVMRLPKLAKPFGGQGRQWESLKAEIKPGDEIWTFAAPADHWKNSAGRAGVALGWPSHQGRCHDRELT
jgi:hypothetical protein